MYNKINGRITQVNQAQRDSNNINNTTIGTWNRLTTTLNDFFAKAGVGIDTALIPLMNAFNQLLSVLQQNTGFEKFLGVFLVAGVILGGLALVIGILVAAIAMSLQRWPSQPGPSQVSSSSQVWSLAPSSWSRPTYSSSRES